MPDQAMVTQGILEKEAELDVLESHIREALSRARRAGASDAHPGIRPEAGHHDSRDGVPRRRTRAG